MPVTVKVHDPKKEELQVEAFQHVPKNRIQQIKAAFDGMADLITPVDIKMQKLIADIGEKEPTDAHVKTAKEIWSEYQDLFKQFEEKRKEEKEVYRRVSEAIDAYAKVFTGGLVEGKELSKKIIKHAELKEQKRKEELQVKRMELIKDWVTPGFEKDLSGMDDDVFEAYAAKLKAEAEAKAAEEEKLQKEADAAKAKYALAQQRMREIAAYVSYITLPELGEISEEEFQALKVEGEKAKKQYEVEQYRKNKISGLEKYAKPGELPENYFDLTENEFTDLVENLQRQADAEKAAAAPPPTPTQKKPAMDLPGRLDYLQTIVERLPNDLQGEEQVLANSAMRMMLSTIKSVKAKLK